MCGVARTGAAGRFGVGRGGAYGLSWTVTLLCAGGGPVDELVPAPAFGRPGVVEPVRRRPSVAS